MELQRHLMLMHTSCGWFFDDISGIETVQVIQYAARAVQLAQDVFGEGLESHLVDALAAAKSNIAEHQDGACIYQKFAKPAMVTLQKVAAHYAISSLFKPHSGPTPVYHYNVEAEDYRSLESGKTRLVIGHAKFSSEITRVTETLVFSALHLGDHNLNCGIKQFAGEEAFQQMAAELTEAFSRADLPGTLRLMDKEFGEARYSLKSLFRDGQRAVLEEVLTATLDEAEASYRQIHENQAPLISFLRDLGVPLPKAMRASAQAAVNSLLRHEFAADEMDIARVQSLLEESRASSVDLDSPTLEYTLRKTIEKQFDQFLKNPADPEILRRLPPAVHLARSLPFEVVLWSAQNGWFEIRRTAYEEFANRDAAGDAEAHPWVEQFRQLGEELRISVN